MSVALRRGRRTGAFELGDVDVWDAVRASTALAGACWTQLTDAYQAVNGLLRANRTPKVPLDDVAAATRW